MVVENDELDRREIKSLACFANNVLNVVVGLRQVRSEQRLDEALEGAPEERREGRSSIMQTGDQGREV